MLQPWARLYLLHCWLDLMASLPLRLGILDNGPVQPMLKLGACALPIDQANRYWIVDPKYDSCIFAAILALVAGVFDARNCRSSIFTLITFSSYIFGDFPKTN